MIGRRITLPILALLVTAVAPAVPTKVLAPMLPEVQKHLNQAENCLSKGLASEAVAHCDVVLVANEIPVAIAYDHVQNAQIDACHLAVEQATAAWEDALQGRVKFLIVDDQAAASVVVVFRSNVLLKGEPVAGLLNWKRTIDKPDGSIGVVGRFKGEMQVRITMPDGNRMPSDAIRHTVTHEMGHVFGLEDTDVVGDLMGPLNIAHPLTGPMPQEIEAVIEFRDHVEQIRAQAQKLILK